MNKKRWRFFEPNMRFYFIFLIIFAVITFFYGEQGRKLAVIEAVIILVLYIYSKVTGIKRRNEMLKYLESMTNDVDSATKDTLTNFPLPVVIFSIDTEEILWSNDSFLEITGSRQHVFEYRISDIVPGFNGKWLMEGKTEYLSTITLGDRHYKVFGSLVRTERSGGGHNYMATTYWMDISDHIELQEEFTNSRPIVSIIMLDNYDELLKKTSEKEKSAILSKIDDKIGDWTGTCNGLLCKYDRDRYIFIFEERHLQQFIDGKFSLLDTAKQVQSPGGINATISIGIGKDGKSFGEGFQFANLGIEMALSRGGDQVVIKNQFNFEFYGGRTSEPEKRTKVKSRVMANAMSELIVGASNIFIMGHKYADLDSVGSAVGIVCLARARGKNAKIIIDREHCASEPLIARLETLPEYADVFISPADAMLELSGRSLLVVVDTNRPEQVEAEEILMSCNRIAVIDHHRRAATYIQNAALNFHEPYASSTSELVSELLQYIVEQDGILRMEAEALLAGIMLDTKNFTLRTGSRTFEAAAYLRRSGADTTVVKQFLQNDLATVLARNAIISHTTVYHNCIAIASPLGVTDMITAAQAADEMLNMAGIQASFVVYGDGKAVRISARSLGRINVQVIAEKLGGGGNNATAAAQIKDKPQDEVTADLKSAIDSYISENNIEITLT